MVARRFLFSVLVLPVFWVLTSTPVKAQNESVPFRYCVSVVGDSIPEGRLVVMVPGHGFPVLKTASMAEVLQQHFTGHGLSTLPVYDRSVGAANLSPLGKTPYDQTEAFQLLLRDHCRFLVMFAWNNDLNVVRPEGAAGYVDDVADFIALVHLVNPATHVLVLSHYWGAPQEFVEGFGVGVTLQNYRAHVDVFQVACQPGGRLVQLSNISCLETQPIFEGMGTSFVVLERSRDQVLAMISEPIPPEALPLLDVYWRENPNGLVYGDGVHLSAAGKSVFAEAIVRHLLALASDW
jgi:hypothetical protein